MVTLQLTECVVVRVVLRSLCVWFYCCGFDGAWGGGFTTFVWDCRLIDLLLQFDVIGLVVVCVLCVGFVCFLGVGIV